MIKKTQRQFIFQIIIITVFIIATFLAITRFQPKPSETPISIIQTYSEKPKKIISIQYIGQPPTFPEEIAVYSAQSIDINSVLETLINKYSLIKSDLVDNAWLNPQTNTTLVYSTRPDRITITFNSATRKDSLETQFTSINTSSAIKNAKSIQQSLFPSEHLFLDEKHITYGDLENPNVPKNNATLITLPFIFSTNSLQTVSESEFQTPLIVTLNKNNSLARIEYSPIPTPTTITQQQKILSLDQVFEKIKNNQSEVLTTRLMGAPIVVSEMQEIEISSILLEYRYSTQKQQFIPYFRLEAVGKKNGAIISGLTLILPAIEL